MCIPFRPAAAARVRFRRHLSGLACAAGLAVSGLASAAPADLVNFELAPDGTTPIDNALLSAPYAIGGGGTVRFYFDSNGNNTYDDGSDALPRFELVGNADAQNGFFNDALRQYDIPGAGSESQLGSYFLRQPAAVGAVLAPFVIDYDTAQTITSFSGEIWDIDGATDPNLAAFGNERWLIEALDASNQVIGSQLSVFGTEPMGPYNARPWTFSFSNLPAGLDKVRITFAGSKTNGIGLAFDNFSPTVAVVPEPSSLALLALGLATLGFAAARRRARCDRVPGGAAQAAG